MSDARPTTTTRFPIRFDRLYGVLSTALFMPPSKSYVEVGGDQVRVRMSWGFRAELEFEIIGLAAGCSEF